MSSNTSRMHPSAIENGIGKSSEDLIDDMNSFTEPIADDWEHETPFCPTCPRDEGDSDGAEPEPTSK